MENILSQWVIDLIGCCGFFLIWLPLTLGLVFVLIVCVVIDYKNTQLEEDYYFKLSDEDKKVIDNYKENTKYLRVKRRLRRISKNLNNNK